MKAEIADSALSFCEKGEEGRGRRKERGNKQFLLLLFQGG